MITNFVNENGDVISVSKNGVLLSIVSGAASKDYEFKSELTTQSYFNFLCHRYKEQGYKRLD